MKFKMFEVNQLFKFFLYSFSLESYVVVKQNLEDPWDSDEIMYADVFCSLWKTMPLWSVGIIFLTNGKLPEGLYLS